MLEGVEWRYDLLSKGEVGEGFTAVVQCAFTSGRYVSMLVIFVQNLFHDDPVENHQ